MPTDLSRHPNWNLFQPPAGLSSPHLQSLLNSSGLRGRLVRRRSGALEAAEQEWMMDGGDGVRLVGQKLYNRS